MKTLLNKVNQKLSENSVTVWDFCNIQQTVPTGVLWFLPSLWRGVCQQQLQRVPQLKSDRCQKTDKISFLEKNTDSRNSKTSLHSVMTNRKAYYDCVKAWHKNKTKEVQNQTSSICRWRQHSKLWSVKTLKRNSEAHFHLTLLLLFDKDIRNISSIISISSNHMCQWLQVQMDLNNYQSKLLILNLGKRFRNEGTPLRRPISKEHQKWELYRRRCLHFKMVMLIEAEKTKTCSQPK